MTPPPPPPLIAIAGYRNVSQFRALYHQLSSCGVITARRGGLSRFGEERRHVVNEREGGDDDRVVEDDNNWVAVRYESALHAHKALCQHGNIVNVGVRGTVIFGVMPMSAPGVSAKLLGIESSGSSSSSSRAEVGGAHTSAIGVLGSSSSSTGGGSNRRQLRSDADVVRDYDEEETKYDLDSLCGKVLAWFFMWD